MKTVPVMHELPATRPAAEAGGQPSARTARFGRNLARVASIALLALGLAHAPLAWSADEAKKDAPAKVSGYSKKGADTCLGCHDDDPSLLGIFRNVHGSPTNARSPFGHGQLQCESCHGPGDLHAKGKGRNRPKLIDFGKGSATPVAVQNGACLTCHNGTASHWAMGPHADADVSCADCHSSHKKSDPVLTAATQQDTCGTCHKHQHAAERMPYRHPLAEGKMSCTSCHTPHGSNTPAQLVKNSVTETCTSCHSELRGPFLWEHQPVAEDCTTCHSPHGSVNLAMLKARGPFQCQQCHETSGHPSIAFGSNNLPGGTGTTKGYVLAGNCLNCHTQVHGSNHPSGAKLMR